MNHREWISVGVSIVLIGVAIVQPYSIAMTSGDSMEPTLTGGCDIVVLDTSAHHTVKFQKFNV